MNTLAFTKHLKSKGLTNVFPNNIPTGMNGVTGVYSYSSTMDKYNTHGTVRFQFITVHKDLNIGESLANNVINWLLNSPIDNDIIEDFEILNTYVLQLSPMYLSIDEEQRYRWTFNIELDIKKFK